MKTLLVAIDVRSDVTREELQEALMKILYDGYAPDDEAIGLTKGWFAGCLSVYEK